MAEKETPSNSNQSSSSTPTAEVQIIPPQSVSVQNSMPKDKLPPQITDKAK